MGGYYLYHLCGSYARKVLQALAVAYSVVEQLEIREALRDWCGQLSVRREHRSEST